MRTTKVKEILLPYKKEIPLSPSVDVSDKITYAIELMANNDLNCIAVIRNRLPIGLVRLDDAFEKLGLRNITMKNGFS